MIRGSYSESCDIWSIGVIAYILLCGYPPFNVENDDDDAKLYEVIQRGQYKFPDPDWTGISHLAKDFLFKTIEVNPSHRLTAGQALSHPWIKKHTYMNLRDSNNRVAE